MPGWYCQLDELAGLALPEPWRFRNPDYHTKNPDTPILERYIHSIFKKQVIDFNEERNPEKAANYLHVENEFVCFHTGLVFPGLFGRAFTVAQIYKSAPEKAQLLYGAVWRQLQPGVADTGKHRPHFGRRGEPFPPARFHPRRAEPAPATGNGS